MFTGIVTDIGEISDVELKAEGLRHVVISCSYDRASIAIGASIACSGICLTVVETGLQGGRTWFAVDAAAETVEITNVRAWKEGTRINLERSLKIGDELGGHLVSGHVDGIALVRARDELTDQVRFTLSSPAPLSRFIARKGSVALDGASLTVNEVDGDDFSVLIIPHTLQVTTLSGWQPGTPVHLEVDQMARYAARLIETRP
jgi:riboflavin synthase